MRPVTRAPCATVTLVWKMRPSTSAPASIADGGREDPAHQAPGDHDLARDDVAFDIAVGGDHQAERGNAAYDPAGNHKLAINLQHAANRNAVTQERGRFLSFNLRNIVSRARCRGSTGHCQHEHPCSRHGPPAARHHGRK